MGAVEGDAGGVGGAAEYGLTVGKSGQCGGVEATEGVEGVPFVVDAADGGVQKAEIEGGVMANQNRALAAMTLGSGTNGREQMIERLPLIQCATKRVADIDASDFQRSRIDLRAEEWVDMRGDDFAGIDGAVVLHFDRNCGNFQQRMPFGIEAAGFDIDHDRQESAKSRSHGARGKGVTHEHRIAHALN
ncbi:MAG: hypothetical protein BWZ07_01499 [Alphaproteobacteria bacterium ADurb.BinA280]|nr:MAG: hypothetical protein BWZ07_01499 [Alphaproteobacteria bacterium ADurb.BinA280]